jgi:hypothetical protein
MGQIVQVVGSLLVLTAFLAAQSGRLTSSSRTYLALNLAGSTVLAVAALVGQLWGFLLLEAAWAAVSAVGLLGTFRGGREAHELHP